MCSFEAMKYRGKHRERRIFVGLGLVYTTVAVFLVLSLRFLLTSS
jgi:hypothetical protein